MNVQAGANVDRGEASWRWFFRALVAPAPGLERPGDRRRAELLAGLLLLVVALGLLSGLVQLAAVPNFMPRFLTTVAAVALLLVAYALSRTRAYRLAVVIGCLAPLGGGLVVLNANADNPMALPFMLLAVLFATLFLSTFEACLTAVCVLALVIAMPLLFPNLSILDRWVPAVAFHAIMAVLLVVAARHRNRLEMQLERQLAAAQRFATAGRLAAGLGHDLNNLLALMLDLQSQVDSKDDKLTALLGRANGAGMAAAKLVQRVLAVARSQDHVSEQTLVDLNDVLREATDLLSCAAGKRCELIVRYHDGRLPCRVDTLDLQRILINLASNAAQAMPQGGRLILETRVVEGGRQAAILVQDSGRGMDASGMARAFQPFVSSREDQGGVGMGLTIVADLVERQGGALEVRSEPGRGTSFTIRLPLI